MRKTEKEHPNDSRSLEDKGENLRRERQLLNAVEMEERAHWRY